MRIIAQHLEEEDPYREELVRELIAYNDKNGPLEKWEYIAFYALDDAGALIGGVHGNLEWDWLHIRHLWVKDPGKGIGRQLMAQAEKFTQEKKKTGILLDTFAFQAKIFYEKIGFTLMGTIENAAGPHARYFMIKRI